MLDIWQPQNLEKGGRGRKCDAALSKRHLLIYLLRVEGGTLQMSLRKPHRACPVAEVGGTSLCPRLRLDERLAGSSRQMGARPPLLGQAGLETAELWE